MSAVGTMIYHGLCRRSSIYIMFCGGYNRFTMGFVGDQVSTICCMDVRAVQIYIASTIEEIVSFEFLVFGLVVGV